MPQVLNLRDRDVWWRVNAGDPTIVKVDRTTDWGNPWPITPTMTREQVLEKYQRWLLDLPQITHDRMITELRGKDLACWCAPKDCHADILLDFVNRTRP